MEHVGAHGIGHVLDDAPRPRAARIVGKVQDSDGAFKLGRRGGFGAVDEQIGADSGHGLLETGVVQRPEVEM